MYNVIAGEDVVLPTEASEEPRSYLLRRPEFRQTSVTLPAGGTELVIDDADAVGLYGLAEAAHPADVLQGFSVNAAAEESDLTRLETAELDSLLGAGRFQVARSIGELDASVNITDLGREVFPIVLLLVIVVFLGEHLVANRFYEMDDDLPATAATKPVAKSGSKPGAPALVESPA